MVERVDLAPGELGREALRVPVRQQADDDDCLLDPVRQALGQRSTRPVDETFETVHGVPALPAMEARPADPEPERRGDAVFPGQPHSPSTEPQVGRVALARTPWRATPASGQEQEPRALLVGVTEESAMRNFSMVRLKVVHAGTLGRAITPCLINPELQLALVVSLVQLFVGVGSWGRAAHSSAWLAFAAASLDLLLGWRSSPSKSSSSTAPSSRPTCPRSVHRRRVSVNGSSRDRGRRR